MVDNLSPDQAAERLAYVRRVEQQVRLRVALGYPYFLIWGTAWAAGYLASAADAIWGWAIVLPAAAVASGVFTRRSSAREASTPDGALVMSAATVVSAGLVLIGVVFAPLRDPVAAGAYYPVAFGTVYVAIGVYAGRAFTVIGLWDIAIGLIALVLPETAAFVLLSVGAGGGMIATGLWLRRFLQSPVLV